MHGRLDVEEEDKHARSRNRRRPWIDASTTTRMLDSGNFRLSWG